MASKTLLVTRGTLTVYVFQYSTDACEGCEVHLVKRKAFNSISEAMESWKDSKPDQVAGFLGQWAKAGVGTSVEELGNILENFTAEIMGYGHYYRLTTKQIRFEIDDVHQIMFSAAGSSHGGGKAGAA